MVVRVKGAGVHVHPHHLPSRWNVRQKVAIATPGIPLALASTFLYGLHPVGGGGGGGGGDNAEDIFSSCNQSFPPGPHTA